jgi:hypothetical protein
MRRICIVLLILITPHLARAQAPAERDAVMKAMETFLSTMTARDIEGARTILVPQGRFHRVQIAKDKQTLGSMSNEEFLAQLQASKQTFRERIWNPEVRVHGPIATLWAPYDFWIDGKFSHCGVDAFEFVKTDEGWKVAGGTYTIEFKCDPSPLGPLKQH